MAPDFEKKREPRRVAAGYIQSSIDKGMILQRFANNPLSDYYRHGKSSLNYSLLYYFSSFITQKNKKKTCNF